MAGKNGCCVDESCKPSTCMDLPEGVKCADCAHERRCATIFGGDAKNTHCQWFPRRLLEVVR
jgi:hypothetical protein